ncbi:hypothetical protein Tco_1177690 [Tanacetum coccineum]
MTDVERSSKLLKHMIQKMNIKFKGGLLGLKDFKMILRVTAAQETTSNSVEMPKPDINVYSRRPKQIKSVGSSKKAKIVEFKIANNSKPNHLWGSNATDVPSLSRLSSSILAPDAQNI